MEKRLTMFFACLFLSIGMALAQTKVTGTVVSSEDNEPVIGASVKVVGTKVGVATDIDGKFSLVVSKANAELEISSIGMVTKRVKASANMQVVLDPDNQTLSQVVVTGYGAAKKVGAVVGAIGTVGSEKLGKITTPNFTDALAGQVSGLSVLSAGGDPSQSATIRLRGVNFLQTSNQPLFILDGAPISSTFFSTLNPDDIANITVLKDAASTSIYGARAANGVILITSKQGRYNESAQLSVKAQFGISTPTSDGAEMMNSEQYIQFRDLVGQPVTDKVRNLVSKYGFNTDWYKEILNDNAPTYDINATMQGGSQTVNYYLSYNHHKQQGLIDKSAMQRSTLNARINARLNKYFKVGFTSNLGVHDYEQNAVWKAANSGQGHVYVNDPLVLARKALPYDVPYYYTIDDNGNLIKGDRAAHLHYSDLDAIWFDNQYRAVFRKRITLNMSVNEVLTPIDGLTLTAQQSLNGYHETLDNRYIPWMSFETPMGDLMGSRDKYGNLVLNTGATQNQLSSYYQYNLTHTAEYRKNFGDHYLNVLLGEETRIQRSKGFGAFAQGQTDARRLIMGAATSVSVDDLTDSQSEVVANSVFGSAEYNYKEKYYAYGSLRRDGSSKFAPNHRWGTFWSLGAKWNAKKESFLSDVNWLNDLSVSVNYGTTGSDAGPGAYDYFGLFGTGGLYNGEGSIGIAQPANSELTWEKVAKLNIGFNARVFDRLNLEFNYYSNKSSDMIMEIPYSFTTGFSSGVGNVGNMTNKGIEIDAQVDILKNRDFNWTVKANVGYNKNEITALFGGRDSYTIQKTGMRYEVGRAYGEFYLPRRAGVDPRDGAPMWYDKDGNITKVFDEANLAVWTGKNRYAPWIGGFGTNFTWKGLSLIADFSWQSSKYMLVNDDLFTASAHFATDYNQQTKMLNIWTHPGQITDIPGAQYDTSKCLDDNLLQNASFLRMKTLSLQYDFPKKWMAATRYIKGFKVFGIIRNLFTITSFKGYDPEPDINLVHFNYPNTRQFVMGAEVTF